MSVNPFDLSDSKIRDLAYQTHLNDNAKCDTQILFTMVSTLLSKSRLPEGGSSNFQPGLHTLKLISSQMINATSGVQYVHQTTMWILEQFKNYSWDAKALLALAAFAFKIHGIESLEAPRTNEMQSRNRWRIPPTATNLVDWVMEALKHIWEWLKLSSSGYYTEDVPSLSDAFNEIPLLVYWIMASLVASIANTLTSSDYKLSYFIDRLSFVDNNLKERLNLIKKEIDEFEDYLRRKEMFSQTGNAVSMLRILCQPTPFETTLVYYGEIKTKKDFAVFSQQHVLLYISGFNSIDSEISFLNYIHKKLEENPKEAVKGYRKEEFKILCIPIVDNKDDSAKIKLRFETLKKYIKCYAVEYFSKLPGLRLIKEKLNYTGKAIMPVLTPTGDMMNEDAMDLIFQWGIEAFPFRKIDGEDLSLKWRWFWDVLKKLKIRIQLEGRKYIFIYGGNNRGWIQNLALALDKIKEHETIQRADNVIEHYQLGKNDPGAIYRFWKEIEIKKASNLGSEIQEKMESLLCLKGDPHGWVVLSKGSNVKILGHMEPMCETVMDFEIWKDKVLQKEGFDIALKEYYDAMLKELEAQKLKELEAQRLKEMEAQKLKQMESQKLKEMEAQRLKEMEAQRLKEMEAQKLKEMEAQRLKEMEAQRLKEMEAQKLKQMEAQRVKDLEAHKLKQMEAQKLKEQEAQKLKQMETQKLKEQEANHKLNDDDHAKVKKKVPVDATPPPFKTPKKSICEQICSCIKGIFEPCCSCD